MFRDNPTARTKAKLTQRRIQTIESRSEESSRGRKQKAQKSTGEFSPNSSALQVEPDLSKNYELTGSARLRRSTLRAVECDEAFNLLTSRNRKSSEMPSRVHQMEQKWSRRKRRCQRDPSEGSPNSSTGLPLRPRSQRCSTVDGCDDEQVSRLKCENSSRNILFLMLLCSLISSIQRQPSWLGFVDCSESEALGSVIHGATNLESSLYDSSGPKTGDHLRKLVANKTRSKVPKIMGISKQLNSSMRYQSTLGTDLADSQQIETPDRILQSISVTARISRIRIPVDSNVMLKCLISTHSAQSNNKFNLIWSRYMYDEGVYEQLEGLINSEPDSNRTKASSRSRRESPAANQNSKQILPSFDRQQQLRNFQARSRQEIKQISDMLIEATLSISPVEASDNATYFCTATNHRGDEKVAKIDLITLTPPIVQLEKVQPSRDSKFAIVFWCIMSDGNTPIRRTILMVRNQTSLPASRQSWRPFKEKDEHEENINSDQDFSAQKPSNVVIDADLNQWQKIDIDAEGERIETLLGRIDTSIPAGVRPTYNGVGGSQRADLSDIDVTSSVDRQPQQSSIDSSSSNEAWLYSPGFRSKTSRMRFFNLTSLLPGFTYSLKLAAINDMGQSNWTELMLTMPNEIPAQISEVFLLSRKNDSLVIGWRRPLYDTSKTIRYEMQLLDLNRTLTIDANTNIDHSQPAGSSGQSHPQRTNFMYFFANLNPGTDYHFHVRACSRFGCSDYSVPGLLASTLDGEPDEPLDVELTCLFDSSRSNVNKLTVGWLPPINVRGQLINYTLLIDARSSYRNQSAQMHLDEWRSTLETNGNQTSSFELDKFLVPNTNYTVRVCANNRSKHCGRLSLVTPSSQCSIPGALPSELPKDIRLSNRPLELHRPGSQNDQSGLKSSNSGTDRLSVETLMLELPHISMRNGTIDCIQIVLIRLPSLFEETKSLLGFLPRDPANVELSPSIDELRSKTKNFELAVGRDSMEENDGIPLDNSSKSQHVTRRILTTLDPNARNSPNSKDSQERSQRGDILAYIADELDESQWQWHRLANGEPQRIVLGDGSYHSCQASPKIRSNSNFAAPVFDAQLGSQTFYSGFLRLIQMRVRNNTKRSTSEGEEVIAKVSSYFPPVKTGHSVPQLAQLALDFPSSSPDQGGLGGLGLNLGEGFQLSTPLSLDPNSSFMNNLKELSVKVGSTLKYNLSKWQDTLAHFLSENARLESVSSFILNSSPLMQVLEVGLIVISLTLVILMLVYFATIPSSQRRKRKKRAEMSNKYKIESRANKDNTAPEKQINHMAQPDKLACPAANGFDQTVEKPQQAAAEATRVSVPDDNESNAQYRNNPTQNAYPVNSECPIHSSPSSRFTVDRTVYHYHEPNYQQRQQYERNCRSMRRVQANEAESNCYTHETDKRCPMSNEMTLNHQPNSVLAYAKKISKPVPLRLFPSVFECRLQNGWLREEYDQLPRSSLVSQFGGTQLSKQSSIIRLQPEMIVSRAIAEPSSDEQDLGQANSHRTHISTLISGNDRYDASIVKPFTSTGGESVASRIICARSPLDADSVWDFWRLVLEQEVSTLIMLTHTEDPQSGEQRCAQYWPTCDNEETTILSPCNEFVQKSSIPAGKFKIRQETLEASTSEAQETGRTSSFRIRRLTLMVLPSRASDNQSDEMEKLTDSEANNEGEEEEEVAIIERDILHFQFTHWNMSSLANQMRLIKFVELANERHLRSQSTSEAHLMRPMLVHCTNGLGRSGLFTALSLIIDELALKLQFERQLLMPDNSGGIAGQQQIARINIFQLISRLRVQREMLLSPYRFYELLYQLTSNCIPSHQELKQLCYTRN